VVVSDEIIEDVSATTARNTSFQDSEKMIKLSMLKK